MPKSKKRGKRQRLDVERRKAKRDLDVLADQLKNTTNPAGLELVRQAIDQRRRFLAGQTKRRK